MTFVIIISTYAKNVKMVTSWTNKTLLVHHAMAAVLNVKMLIIVQSADQIPGSLTHKKCVNAKRDTSLTSSIKAASLAVPCKPTVSIVKMASARNVIPASILIMVFANHVSDCVQSVVVPTIARSVNQN